MPRLFRIPILGLAIAAALAPCGCGQRVAGTTTTAENTISGMAMLPDGRPAAGAVVAARASVVVLSRNAVPESRLLALVNADSAGKFLLPLPRDERFYLEIRSTSLADSATVSRYQEFSASTPVQIALGRFTLDSAVEIRGTLAVEKGVWNTRAWVGISGTDLFRAVSPEPGAVRVPFSLPGAPASARSLVVYLEPSSPVQQNSNPVPVDSIAIPIAGSGPVRDVGEIRFQAR